MKIKRIIALLICLTAGLICACQGQNDYNGKAKVIYNLEGGTYQNTQRAIIHYYEVDENGNAYICEPEKLSGKKIERSGYHIEGWYQTKTQNGEEAVYSDKWNFESDKVGVSGLTLYAKWALNIKYTYNVCYINEAGEKVILGEYPVSQGAKFKDFANYAKKRYDGVYTPVGFVDSEGNPWNNDFTHPGGEQSLAIDVYVSYIKGNFAIVSTASQLKAAKGKNVYLTADIDMEGETLNFGDYKGEFWGNGYTVSNFKISYDPGKDGVKEDIEDSTRKSLYISLFGDAKGAIIKDVNFVNVSVDIDTGYSVTYKIYVAPIAISLTESTVSNVTFTGTYTVTRIPDGMAEENLVIVNGGTMNEDENSTLSNLNVAFSKAE